jgi:flagellar biogenesis protein FliO
MRVKTSSFLICAAFLTAAAAWAAPERPLKEAVRDVPPAAETQKTAPAPPGASVSSDSAAAGSASKDAKSTNFYRGFKEKRTGKFGPGVTHPDRTDEVASIGVSPYRVFAALVTVAAAMGLFFWLLKKFFRGYSGGKNASLMTIRSRLQLDSKNSVALVKVYEDEYLLGIGPEGVRLLNKLAPIETGETAGIDDEPGGAEDSGVKLELDNVSGSGEFKNLRDMSKRS